MDQIGVQQIYHLSKKTKNNQFLDDSVLKCNSNNVKKHFTYVCQGSQTFLIYTILIFELCLWLQNHYKKSTKCWEKKNLQYIDLISLSNLSNMTCSISKKTVCLHLSLNYQSILSDIFVEAIIISIYCSSFPAHDSLQWRNRYFSPSTLLTSLIQQKQFILSTNCDSLVFIKCYGTGACWVSNC